MNNRFVIDVNGKTIPYEIRDDSQEKSSIKACVQIFLIDIDITGSLLRTQVVLTE